MTPVVTHALSKHFMSVRAIDALTLEVPQGAVYALVGPNGAGKTTALKTLMNIHQPSSGSAEVLGCDSRKLGPAQFQRIGYVSENQKLPEWMTVEYFLRYLVPFYPAWDSQLADKLVRHFGLPLDRKLKHLSRGMKMLAALASSLAYRPELIVLDEPFSGLDALVRDEFIQALLEHCENATVLISSHDLAEIETFASHVGFLDKGHLLFSEELQSLTAHFREVEIAFDTPPAATAPFPASWLSPESSGVMLRFVDSSYDTARLDADIRQRFAAIRSVDVRPMPLRAIFVALAQSMKKAA